MTTIINEPDRLVQQGLMHSLQATHEPSGGVLLVLEPWHQTLMVPEDYIELRDWLNHVIEIGFPVGDEPRRPKH